MSVDTGKCHCGQTEWTVKLGERTHVLCHCDACKKLGGGAFTLNRVVPKEDVKITKGTLNKYTYYGDSGNAVYCYYCQNCTTHAFQHQTVMGDNYVVRTIHLEGGDKFQPAAEVYGKDRLPWLKEVATTFDTTPPK